MSSPPQPQPPKGDREKRAKGFGKVLSKVKIALRRGESSSSASKPPPPVSSLAAQPPVQEEPQVESKPAPPSEPVAARARYQGMAGMTKVARSQLFEDRAKKLSERYGLDISIADWYGATPDDDVLRVDKPIRIRVRRTCHRCNTAFTAAKECHSCHHLRCTKCSRYPPKRTEAEKLASLERREAMNRANKENPQILADYSYCIKGILLKRPSKTGGQDLYHKKPRQRVRRTCHECQTQFMTGSKKCDECSHIRCTDCPRDPPKKNKYPFGYPGDAFGPNSIPRYECDRCETLYPVDVEPGTACKKCGLVKSDASPRALPRKVEPEPDPEVLRSIQAKLDKLRLA